MGRKLFKCPTITLFEGARRTQLVEELALFLAFSKGLRMQAYYGRFAVLGEHYRILNFERANLAERGARDAAPLVGE
jgi:hypothetical protein